jgi:hypothetical protein
MTAIGAISGPSLNDAMMAAYDTIYINSSLPLQAEGAELGAPLMPPTPQEFALANKRMFPQYSWYANNLHSYFKYAISKQFVIFSSGEPYCSTQFVQSPLAYMLFQFNSMARHASMGIFKIWIDLNVDDDAGIAWTEGEEFSSNADEEAGSEGDEGSEDEDDEGDDEAAKAAAKAAAVQFKQDVFNILLNGCQHVRENNTDALTMINNRLCNGIANLKVPFYADIKRDENITIIDHSITLNDNFITDAAAAADAAAADAAAADAIATNKGMNDFMWNRLVEEVQKYCQFFFPVDVPLNLEGDEPDMDMLLEPSVTFNFESPHSYNVILSHDPIPIESMIGVPIQIESMGGANKRHNRKRRTRKRVRRAKKTRGRKPTNDKRNTRAARRKPKKKTRGRKPSNSKRNIRSARRKP